MQRASRPRALSDTLNKTQISGGNRQEKLFFFYAQKSTQTTERRVIEQCDKLVRQCDELKLIEHYEIPSVMTSPVRVEVDSSTVFATPPPAAVKSRDVDVQTVECSPIVMPSEPPLPPCADLIFSHMNTVNQRITEFCANHEAMQNDINTIRVSVSDRHSHPFVTLYSIGSSRTHQSSHKSDDRWFLLDAMNSLVSHFLFMLFVLKDVSRSCI